MTAATSMIEHVALGARLDVLPGGEDLAAQGVQGGAGVRLVEDDVLPSMSAKDSQFKGWEVSVHGRRDGAGQWSLSVRISP